MKVKLQKFWQKIKSFKLSVDDLKKIKNDVLFFSTFMFLLLINLGKEVLSPLGKIKFIQEKFKTPLKKLAVFYEKVVGFFDTAEKDTISSSDLIGLALRHLKAKKTRTIITIGGMAIGIGAIVLLLSLGYGAQRLVVSRVARLDEMRQADVAIGQASSLFLNGAAIDSFKGIEKVEHVLPLVSLVSKVSFNNSVSDVVAYGVTSQFLDQSAIKTIQGKIFQSDDNLSLVVEQEGIVAGAALEIRTDAKLKKEIYEIDYAIHPLVWKKVYEEPSSESMVIGYTKRTVGNQEAVEVWGELYKESDPTLTGIDVYGNRYDRWVKDSFPIWEKASCEAVNPDCFENEYLLSRVGTNQLVTTGYVTEDQLSIERFNILDNGLPEPKEGEFIERVQFSVSADKWLSTYLQPKESEQLLGLYTKSESGNDLLEGDLVWGGSYPDEAELGSVAQNENGQWLGYWIRTTLPMWRKVDCQDCDNYYLVERDEADEQVEMSVYFKANQVKVEDLPVADFGQVLGEATGSAEVNLEEILKSLELDSSDSAEASATSDLFAELGWVEIASATGIVQSSSDPTNKIILDEQAQKVAVVNQAMLRLLGIEDAKAVGETIKISLVFDNSLFKQEDYQAESEEVEFKIVGIVPGSDTPAFYFPFSDLKGTGIDNFSQIKVVAQDKNDLKDIRTAIESMGFKTSSVVDTVGRINGLFNNVRLVLLFLGMIALGVAALGMFNTLTVSLLEKTREVGLMKAMGMRSDEVKRLFLAESIVIGLSGGLMGLTIGFVLGKLISASLSTMAVAKGMGVIDVVYIPINLAISIVLLSLVVGVITGIFPARRTTKISALNALRYE